MPTFDHRFRMATGTDPALEVMRRNHWEIMIQGIDSRLQAVTVQMPKYKIEQVEVYHYNERTKIAGKPNVENFKVELLDVVRPAIVLQLDEWFRQAFNPNTANFGYARDYKRSGTIQLNDVHGNLIRSWTAHGLFLLGSPVSDEAMDYSSMDPVKISCELSCDFVYLNSSTIQDVNATLFQ